MQEQSPLLRHSSRGAVVLLPPRETWAALDEIREKHDAQIVRWMPHIPLVFPFKPPEDFGECLSGVGEVCAGFGPMSFTLSAIRSTRLPSGRGTLWVACEPEDELVALASALGARFPELSPKIIPKEPFVPHIVLGQCRTHLIVERLAGEYGEAWKPLPVVIPHVSLVGREHTGPFQVLHEIPLGSEPSR